MAEPGFRMVYGLGYPECRWYRAHKLARVEHTFPARGLEVGYIRFARREHNVGDTIPPHAREGWDVEAYNPRTGNWHSIDKATPDSDAKRVFLTFPNARDFAERWFRRVKNNNDWTPRRPNRTDP